MRYNTSEIRKNKKLIYLRYGYQFKLYIYTMKKRHKNLIVIIKKKL